MHFRSGAGIQTIHIVSVLGYHLARGGAKGALLSCEPTLGSSCSLWEEEMLHWLVLCVIGNQGDGKNTSFFSTFTER